jgi:23S rRNA (cytidine1920-2'-O)/16S rRNA (cytidine1409-2'-O)-methyltransferase
VQKVRLDVLLTDLGLVESRSKAQAVIMAGQVRVEGEVELKPGTKVDQAARVVLAQPPRFVSRGGEKLEEAFRAFHWQVAGHICADVGSSTGGFTDCLLQHGAARVYAIDVGYGQLDWRLRHDPRVVSMERTNARHIEQLPETVTRVSMDASFISVKILLPVIAGWFGGKKSPSTGEVVALIKPQFEAGRQVVSRGEGVVQDTQVHRQVLQNVLSSAGRLNYEVSGLTRSPLLGPKGNVEFLAWLKYPRQAANGPTADLEVEALIEKALASAESSAEAEIVTGENPIYGWTIP